MKYKQVKKHISKAYKVVKPIAKDVYRTTKKEIGEFGAFFLEQEKPKSNAQLRAELERLQMQKEMRELKGANAPRQGITAAQRYSRGFSESLDRTMPKRELNKGAFTSGFKPLPPGTYRPKETIGFFKKKSALPDLF